MNLYIGLGKRFLRILPALKSHNSGSINRIWQYYLLSSVRLKGDIL